MLSLVAGTPASAQNLSGNDLLETCSAADPTMQGFCVGFIAGLVQGIRYGVAVPMMLGGSETEEVNRISDSLLMYCPPDAVTNGQYVDLTILYLQENPALRHNPARGLFHNSVMAAFPCN